MVQLWDLHTFARTPRTTFLPPHGHHRDFGNDWDIWDNTAKPILKALLGDNGRYNYGNFSPEQWVTFDTSWRAWTALANKELKCNIGLCKLVGTDFAIKSTSIKEATKKSRPRLYRRYETHSLAGQENS